MGPSSMHLKGALTLEGMEQAGVHLPVLGVWRPEQAQRLLWVARRGKGGEAQPVSIGDQLLGLGRSVGASAELWHVRQSVACQCGL